LLIIVNLFNKSVHIQTHLSSEWIAARKRSCSIIQKTTPPSNQGPDSLKMYTPKMYTARFSRQRISLHFRRKCDSLTQSVENAPNEFFDAAANSL